VKKWLIAIGTILLTVALVSMAFAANPIRLYVNGQEINPDVPPQIINGRTMVPVRWVAEALGADVHWDARTMLLLLLKKFQVYQIVLCRKYFEISLQSSKV